MQDEDEPAHRPEGPGSVLVEGRTCWRRARAERFALIVDAARYFASLKAAMIRAERQVLLIGWDFDTRIRLNGGEDARPSGEHWPDRLGAFINALVARRPDLHVHMLEWDLGVVQTLGRGATPLFILDWITHERIHMRLDSVHPLGGCHHQKIAVIDDRLAFCGGIDITVGRWDTPEHRDRDPRRNSPWGFRQPPWHDATAAVDGAAARALGDLARARWQHATGERLSPPDAASGDPWPEALEPAFHGVEVGIARTQPAHAGEPEAREIEAVSLAAIAAARRLVYVESQYLASRRIGDAIARRLAEADGPEVVIVNPCTAEGWLEEEAMGSARSLILSRLQAADRNGRLRVVHPVAEGGTPIYVHAKVMIVDDRLLKVGSSNLNNRSLGLDTECDLVLDAADAPDEVAAGAIREGIRAIRHALLAEHLGRSPAAVAEAETRAGGSMLAAIAASSRPRGRRLVPLEPAPLTEAERALAEARILDPERPVSFAKLAARLVRPVMRRAGAARSRA